jgi:enoyl-CoA hydratase
VSGARVDYDLPDELTIECRGAIRLLTINRPLELNAVNAALHAALAGVWGKLRADTEARVVVLTGAGRTFCAGGDFEWLIETHRDPVLQDFVMDEGGTILAEMTRFPLPVIAAVNGAAVGLGCSVAMMSDIVLMSDAAHLADPHVSVGLVAGDGGAAVWPVLASLLRIKEYLYTGDRISPEAAVQMGLATRVVPAGELMNEALALAERIAKQPRRALQDTKRALNVHLARALAAAAPTGMSGERMSMGSTEHGEILDALLAKRRARGETTH